MSKPIGVLLESARKWIESTELKSADDGFGLGTKELGKGPLIPIAARWPRTTCVRASAKADGPDDVVFGGQKQTAGRYIKVRRMPESYRYEFVRYLARCLVRQHKLPRVEKITGGRIEPVREN